MLDQRAAAFDPVTVVAVKHAADVTHLGAVDMAADHALVAQAARLVGNGHFKVRHIVERALDPVLEVSRQRPVGQAHAGAQAVQVAVELEREFIEVVAHVGEPFGALHHGIEVVAVDDPQLAAVGRGVHGLLHHFNAAELVADKFTRKLIVVARHKNNAATFAGAPQQLLHHVVVGLRPVPLAAQLPAVNNVAHQVQVVARVGLQKVQQRRSLAARCAQMNVRNENRAVALAQRFIIVPVWIASAEPRTEGLGQRSQWSHGVKHAAHHAAPGWTDSALPEKCFK